MRYLLSFLLLIFSSSLAAAPYGPDPKIRQCTKVAQEYGSWALEFRRNLERHSSDRGGLMDASLLRDVNFALVSAGDYVHTNIKFVQTAGIRGETPSVRVCEQITNFARAQIDQYTRRLLDDLHPSDQRGRESLLQEFRVGLYESTRRFQGY